MAVSRLVSGSGFRGVGVGLVGRGPQRLIFFLTSEAGLMRGGERLLIWVVGSPAFLTPWKAGEN